MSQRTRDDLSDDFRRAMRRLRSASERFDTGDEDAAYDLAAHIRLLAHDTDSSTSILQHMGVKDQLLYPDATKLPPPPMEPLPPGTRRYVIPMFGGPWSMEGDGNGWKLVPPFDGAFPDGNVPEVTFDTWWFEPCGHDRLGNRFSRRDLVLDVAHKDGGVHVDTKLREKYAALTREGSLGLNVEGTKVTQPVKLSEPSPNPITGNPALVGIRQAAFELERALSTPKRLDVIDPSKPLPVCAICTEPIERVEDLTCISRRDQETQEVTDIALLHRACWDAW
jgi:hypothetical protein